MGEGGGICSRRRAAMAAAAAEKDCQFDLRMRAGPRGGGDAVRTGMYICICMHTRRVREMRVARVYTGGCFPPARSWL